VSLSKEAQEVLVGLEAIEWLDHSTEADWVPVKQLRTDPVRVLTIGYPVKETDDAIILAPTIGDLEASVEEWTVADAMMILKVAIVSRQVVLAKSQDQSA
jgi:hypothetical protein